jgi:tRNA modification GTPase
MRTAARDTIAAISSALPPPAGSCEGGTVPGRAILRLSGPDALPLAARIFPALIADGTTRLRGWRRIAGTVSWRGHTLPAHAYVMRSPRSYTREDIVELHVPALPWLLSHLLEELLHAGARLAQPGEFTRRALENGRITLDQAEAVAGLIQAQDAGEARTLAARLNRQAHTWQQELRDNVEELLSLVEFGLDFSQEEAGVLPRQELQRRIAELHERLRGICPSTHDGTHALESAVLSAGLPRILLLGPTNAGKSSLFNRLLRRDAAIISPQRHTTRDTVEGALVLPDAEPALLIDSAGCGMPDDCGDAYLQRAAWAVTVSAAKTADIILLLLDRTVPLANAHELARISEALRDARPAALAVVLTKSDLPSAECWRNAEAALGVPVAKRVEVSTVDGRGLDELRAFLTGQLAELGARPRDAWLAAAAAARAAAQAAASALERARAALECGHGEDAVAVELREALHAFWQAEGVLIRHDAITEAALDRIFSRFCVGK